MNRRLSILILISTLNSCSLIDSKQETIIIYNNTDSAVYIYYSCSDSIYLTPKLVLFDTIVINGREKINSPNYRVNAYSYGGIGTTGRKILINNCADKKLRLFFIKEETMINNTWNDIYNWQLYEKKVFLTIYEMEQNDWTVTYQLESEKSKTWTFTPPHYLTSISKNIKSR